MTDYSTWTDEQLRDLATAVISEQERRRTRREAQVRMDEIVAEYESAIGDAPPVRWEDLGDRVGPGERVIWTDGETWRNISGAWLPTTAGPDSYPLGWAQESGLPGDGPQLPPHSGPPRDRRVSCPPRVSDEQQRVVPGGIPRRVEGTNIAC